MIVKTDPDTVPRRRGRPPIIDRERIVATALDLGLDAFSLTDIAGALGVSTPALYSHVEGRDHVLRLAAAQILIRGEARLDEIDDWREWLRQWANLIRAELGGVGEEVLEAVRTSVDPAALRVAEHGLRLLVDAGFDPAEAGYALWLVVRTACTAGPVGRASVDAPVHRAQEAIDEHTSAEMLTAIDAVAAADAEAAFPFDLGVVIAGLEASLADVTDL